MLLISGSLEAVGRVVLLVARSPFMDPGLADSSVWWLRLASVVGPAPGGLLDAHVCRLVDTMTHAARPRGRPRDGGCFVAWVCLDAAIAIYLVAYGIEHRVAPLLLIAGVVIFGWRGNSSTSEDDRIDYLGAAVVAVRCVIFLVSSLPVPRRPGPPPPG